jgi:drug/metabolite transporter (DMT)-like permease
VLAFFIFLQMKNRNGGSVRRDWRHAWPWIITHTLTGPVVGVSCYQWALATTPSGIVLPIVATTPLLVIPFTYLIEHDRPRVRSLIGGAIAVAGAVALTLVH